MIFFDLDGTLFDAGQAQAHSWEEAFLQVTGRRVHLDAIDHHGATSLRLLRLLAEPGSPDRDTIAQLFDAHAAALRRELAGGLAPLPGVLETLTHLVGRSASLGIATGNSVDATCALLAASGLIEFFSAFICGHETESRAELMQRTWMHTQSGRRPVVVGDTPHDIDAALSNDCLAVGVATGIYRMDVLQGHGATLILPHLSGAADAILSLYDMSQSSSDSSNAG